MSKEQMRKDFEAWARENCVQPLTPYGDTFKNVHIRCRWEGWQAALSTQPQAPQGAVTGWQPIPDAEIERLAELHLKVEMGHDINGDGSTEPYAWVEGEQAFARAVLLLATQLQAPQVSVTDAILQNVIDAKELQ